MTKSPSLIASAAKRGRPAQLSRQQILECALGLLEQGPAMVTLSGVARALGCAPMSLYTHVKNRDDLLMGVSDLVLGQLTVALDEQQSWQQWVRCWLFEVRNQLARYPQVVKLIGEAQALPPQWLRVHAVLIRGLVRAGLSGKTLALSSRWLAQLIITDVLLNAPAHSQAGGRAVMDALAQLDEQDQASFALVVPYIDDQPQDLFAFVVEQAIARLEVLAMAV